MQDNTKHNTFGKGSKQRAINGGEDKYYTKTNVSDYLTSLVVEKYGISKTYVEPCAGHGSFVSSLEKMEAPKIEAFDINPEKDAICSTKIQTQDWLKAEGNLKGKIVITNPPFGFMSQLAIDFYNKCAELEADVIAFLVPKTFKKASVQNKLNRHYILKMEVDPLDNSFLLEGESEYSVPCTFQVWERTKKQRPIAVVEKSLHFDFVDKENADIAVRRAGSKAGQVLEGLEHSKESTYFIRINTDKELVAKAFRLMDIGKFVNNTAGVRSISKDEINSEMNRILSILL